MANSTPEAVGRRLPVQADAIEGPPETPLAISSANYQRALDTIITYGAEMINMPRKEFGSIVELSAKRSVQGLIGTRAAPKLFGPTTISLINAWGEDAAAFKYTTIFWVTSVINKKYNEVAERLAKIKEGRTTFTSSTAKDETTQEVTAEADNLRRCVTGLEAGLENLATREWGDQASLYTEVLKLLAGKTANDFQRARRGASRETIVTLVRQGDLQTAREKLDLLFGSN